MIRKLDRIAIVVVSASVGLLAITPGWQIMTEGSVYGLKLPADWLSSYWPFGGFFVAGLLLLVIIGGGCIATAVVNIVDSRVGMPGALLMGIVLIGWIAGERIFLTQTNVMTWLILGAGVLLVGLSLPYSLPELNRFIPRGGRKQAA